MGNVSPKKYDKWLQVRADEAFLATIDQLRAQELPPLSRADYIRRLVLLADRKTKK